VIRPCADDTHFDPLFTIPTTKPVYHVELFTGIEIVNGPLADVGLATLARTHGRLVTLGLNHIPDISGAGLARLGQLPRLEWLEIRSSPRIMDEGLAEVASLESLRRLEVDKGQFSAAAIDALLAALPTCEVMQREAGSI
jgi:hypothetical protein